jgi:hypothetical protein
MEFKKTHKGYWENKLFSKNHKENISKGIINFYDQHPEARKRMSKIMKDIRIPQGKFIVCKNCEKEFYVTPKRSLKANFCSSKCYGLYKSKNKHLYFMFKKGHDVSKQTRLKQKKVRTGKYCGEKSYQWNGGSSFEPYGVEFNNKFRRAIRKRDNQICMLCGIHREKLNRALDVHHVDYNKKLSIQENCISLCQSCHGKTHLNRKHWQKFFQSLLAERYDYQYSETGEIILEIKNED